MKRLKLYPLFIILMIVGIYCKKISLDPSEPGKIEILRGTSLANKKNYIQAIYTSKDNAFIGYYYGSFDAKGNPDSISQMVIKKTQGDTAIQILFDAAMRVKTIYSSVKGVKLNTMLTFDYSIVNKTVINSFYYNFTTSSSKLLYQYTYDTSLKSITNTTSYASVGGGLADILLQVPISTPDPFLSKIMVVSAGYAGAVVVLSAAMGLGAGIVVSSPVVGIVAGILTAYTLVFSPQGNASEIETTSDTPETPFITEYPTIYILSPSNKTEFNIYPRTTTVVWNEVPSVTSYLLEVQVGYSSNDYNTNYDPAIPNQTISTNSATFNGVGSQVHRFRVSALNKTGIITQTPWQYVRYLH